MVRKAQQVLILGALCLALLMHGLQPGAQLLVVDGEVVQSVFHGHQGRVGSFGVELSMDLVIICGPSPHGRASRHASIAHVDGGHVSKRKWVRSHQDDGVHSSVRGRSKRPLRGGARALRACGGAGRLHRSVVCGFDNCLRRRRSPGACNLAAHAQVAEYERAARPGPAHAIAAKARQRAADDARQRFLAGRSASRLTWRKEARPAGVRVPS
eukprot:364569-Chlamydomonas_euryale.AAC.27